MSPHAFTDAFAAAAQATMPSAQVVVKGNLNVETRGATGETTTSDLHNAYEQYRAAPEHAREIIHAYVGTLVDTVQQSEIKAAIDRSRIVPILKNQVWVDATRKVLRALPPDKASEPLTEPFNSKLTIVYVEDHAHSMRYLTTRDDVGDRAKLHDLALANLSHLWARWKCGEPLMVYG